MCTGEPFLYKHPCGTWLLQHSGDDCTEQHGEYDTLVDALQANPTVERIDYE